MHSPISMVIIRNAGQRLLQLCKWCNSWCSFWHNFCLANPSIVYDLHLIVIYKNPEDLAAEEVHRSKFWDRYRQDEAKKHLNVWYWNKIEMFLPYSLILWFLICLTKMLFYYLDKINLIYCEPSEVSSKKKEFNMCFP